MPITRKSLDFILAKRALKFKTSGQIMEIVNVGGDVFSDDGRIYVRVPGGFVSGATTIKNAPLLLPVQEGIAVLARVGRKVRVGEGYDGSLEIKGNLRSDLKQRGINPRQLNHLDPSVRYNAVESLSNFQSYPITGTGTVRVVGSIYRKPDGTFGVYAGEMNIDLLTSYTPATSTNQLIVALWLDTDDNTVNITASSEFSQSVDLANTPSAGLTYLDECVASAPTNNIGIWAYIIRGTDTVISESNKFWDLRGIIGSQGQTTLSGASLTAVTVATDDKVLIQDTSDSDNLKTVTAQSIADLASAGSGNLDLEVTAGENLSERDNIFLNETDNKWYKIDIDASPIACGAQRGIVVESGGILTDATGTIRKMGIVTGYTGLTAGGRIYASSTAGGYTQTKPNPSLGGSQTTIVEMGYAITTTSILLDTKPVQYMIADTLADDATLTIEHHTDTQGRERKLRAYLASVAAGATLAEYASSNQDFNVFLEGLTLTGDSISFSHAGTADGAIGDLGGTDYWAAQTFTTTNGGLFTQFVIRMLANTGSPTGGITWRLQGDNSNAPNGSTVATGTFAVTPSADNTINVAVASQVVLSASTKYWLVFLPTSGPFGTNNRYSAAVRTTGGTPTGGYASSSNNGATWSPVANHDIDVDVTVSAITEKDRLAQSFQVTGTQTVETVRLWLKKTGTPTGTMTLRIETNSAGNPSGSLADANLTTTVAESTLSTSYGYIEFTFSTPASISGSTTYWIVLDTDRAQSNTNYVAWGTDASSPSYADGEMKSELASSWSALSMDAIFEVLGEGVQFDSPALIDDWDTALEVFAARYDDGAGADGDTMTTIKNVTGLSKDAIMIVELP